MKPIKQKKCKVCKEPFTPFSTLAKACRLTCAVLLVEQEKEKKEKKRLKLRKNDFFLNDVSHQHKLTQTVFNKLRVLEEKAWFKEKGIKPYCISCQKENMDWCCGHFKTRGAQGNLRYDRKNTFLQCNRYCNKALSGNIEGNKNSIGYKKGLAKRFGEEEAANIIEYCETNTTPIKWSGLDISVMRKEFSKKIGDIT